MARRCASNRLADGDDVAVGHARDRQGEGGLAVEAHQLIGDLDRLAPDFGDYRRGSAARSCPDARRARLDGAHRVEAGAHGHAQARIPDPRGARRFGGVLGLDRGEDLIDGKCPDSPGRSLETSI